VANWSNPTLTSLYTDFVNEVKNRDVDLALGLDPATTSPTNIPTNAIRWNSANKRWEKYDGTNWNALSTAFSVPMGAQGTPSIYFGTTADAGLYSPGAGQVAISTGGTGRVFVTSGGLVGIGQASPGSALDVAGELRVYPSSGAGIIRFGSGGAEKGKVSVDASSNFAVETAGTERLRITSTGDVNIKGAGTAGSTQAVSFSGSAPVDSLVLTSAGNVGLGTSSVSNTAGYGRQLEVAGTLPCITINQNDAGFTTRKYSIGVGTTGGLSIWDNNASAHRLSITSGGLVGIGIANPGSKLEVQGLGSASGYTSAGNAGIKVDFGAANNGVINLVGGGDLGIYHSNSSGAYDVGISFGDNSNRILRFDTAGGEKMRLDASGNLGLGVTPSANWNLGKALEIGTSTGNVLWGIGINATSLLSNGYYNSGYKYANAGYATRYDCGGGNGTHAWHIAGSGTAGSAITFTQAMTLLGTTTPALLVGTTSDFGGFNFQGKNQVGFSVHNAADSGTAAYFSAAGNVTLTSAGSSAILHGTDGILFGVSGTERARIDSSGRLLVGTTSGSGSVGRIIVQGASNGSATGVLQVAYNGSATTPLSADTQLGFLRFTDQASNGNVFAQIQGEVDATTGAGDYPGRLVFSTTPDGAASPTERARINNQGYLTGTVNGLSSGIYPSKQYFRLNSNRNGANQAAAQSVFGVGVSLVASTVYEFEALYWLQCSSASGSPTMNFLFGGTATINNIMYSGVGPGPTSVLPPLSTYDAAPASFIATSAGASVVSGTLISAVSVIYFIKGSVSINAAGTFIPQYSFDVAPGNLFTTNAGSYFSIWPLGASGSNTSIGSWA
jgi:hypothetical protein